MLHRNRDEVVARERHVAGEQLVQHDAERVDVRLCVHRLSARLLRRDVVGGSEHRARLRHAFHVERARDAEVRDLRTTVSVQEHVLGLHVAVDESLPVRERERTGDLQSKLDCLGDRQAAAAHD